MRLLTPVQSDLRVILQQGGRRNWPKYNELVFGFGPNVRARLGGPVVYSAGRYNYGYSI